MSDKTTKSSVKLFKHYLDIVEKRHNEKPLFLYRINRWRFNTLLRKPLTIAPYYIGHGWLTKGAFVYFVYYWTLKRNPELMHLNREGYYYEPQHKTTKINM